MVWGGLVGVDVDVGGVVQDVVGVLLIFEISVHTADPGATTHALPTDMGDVVFLLDVLHQLELLHRGGAVCGVAAFGSVHSVQPTALVRCEVSLPQPSARAQDANWGLRFGAAAVEFDVLIIF